MLNQGVEVGSWSSRCYIESRDAVMRWPRLVGSKSQDDLGCDKG